MSSERLFHISENPNIKIFKPRISPSHFDAIQAEVVFAISEKLMHNYLLPRECPRIAFYAAENSSKEDIEKLIGTITAPHVIVVESNWLRKIQMTTLFVYEMPVQSYTLLDECAGYYISDQITEPISVRPVYNILEELLKRNVELRFVPTLHSLANMVKNSTLKFSLIRMRNSICP